MRTTKSRCLARAGLLALVGALTLLAPPGTSLAAPAASADDSRVLLAHGAGYADPAIAREVRVLQRKLRTLGWRPGPVDGLFGPRTEQAVEAFQRAARLVPDGIAGPRTRNALDRARQKPLARGAGYRPPAGSPCVRMLQERLRVAGFDPGPVDGLFGPRTQAAVERLQRAGGLSADGIVGQRTRLLLAERRPDSRTARGPAAPGAAPERSRTARRPASEGSRSRDGGTRDRSDSGTRLPTARGMRSASQAIEGLGEDTGGNAGPLLLLAAAALVLMVLAGLLLLRLGANEGGISIPLAQSASFRAPSDSQASWATQGSVAALARPPASGEDGGEAREDPPTDGVRALGYVSISDKESFDDPRFKAQMDEIDSLCERRGWRLVELVRDKEVPSGKALDRPGLGFALERMQAGEVSCLVVSKLRRLSHSVADLGRILEIIGRAGGRLVALDLGIDTSTPEGRKAANVLLAVSGWERQRLAERTRQGLEAARAKGGAVGRPSVNDVPALKQWIVDLRASGLTLQAIADRLNAEGVPTLRGGQKWRPSAVQAAAGYRRPPRRPKAFGGEESPNGGSVQ
jgi:peptidoglycan hydrolase-like protein with peptidoglycan-binding domain/DNA invertase Pin-like site-specific DNA recombinase